MRAVLDFGRRLRRTTLMYVAVVFGSMILTVVITGLLSVLLG